ncbi:hypothetical protein [Roseateles toxinivorans]|uniref:Lipoprotein n=1 Tax=Roseateles toxinivorans TaxID=270368 RepID=A0A4R6QV32_9BURK|nr:hypothetical protein [Roseateles toxinivorans]TDP75064.1 hypothetical protein DES47_1011140 [Roseateles toxinivorans]
MDIPTRHLLLSPLLLAAGCALAQTTEIPEGRDRPIAQVEAHVRAVQDSAAFSFGDLGQERVVKGAAYCADAVHERVQPLADGNRIVHAQSTRLCRDGEGRTRQEVERGGRRIVYLRDPVAREYWMLDTERKTARQIGGMVFADHEMDHGAWREYSERMREWAKRLSAEVRAGVGAGRVVAPQPPGAPAPPLPPAPPAPVVLAPGQDGGLQVLRITGDQVLPPMPGMPPLPPLPPVPPEAVTMRALSLAPRGAGVQSPLGSKEIDGLKVNGERTTWTIAAGKVGNEKPILITREVWTSPELMLTVNSRDFDPRSGEVNYRLQNLRRGEPEAALMRVPADYASTRLAPRRPRASEPTAKG